MLKILDLPLEIFENKKGLNKPMRNNRNKPNRTENRTVRNESNRSEINYPILSH